MNNMHTTGIKIVFKMGFHDLNSISQGENMGLKTKHWVSVGFHSAEPGDSGGGCYTKGRDGVWELSGMLELGGVKVSLDRTGERHEEFDPSKNPHNNGLYLLSGHNGEQWSRTLTYARQIRDGQLNLPTDPADSSNGSWVSIRGNHFRVSE